MTRRFIDHKKTAYLLPNGLTTAALFCGFLAIVFASKGQFEKSILSIVIAAILDALDGRVARLTKSESVFGEVYDSLSDMTSFGVAPAMLAYFWLLQDFNNIGSAAVFVYLAGAAMRLARFTSQTGEESSYYFSGLPSPAAALCVASFIWVMVEFDSMISWPWVEQLMLPFIAIIGLLMVSSVPYYSFKKIPFRKHLSFSILAAVLLLVCALLLIDPVISMALFFWGYAILVPLGYYGWLLLRKKKKGNKATLAPPQSIASQSKDKPERLKKVQKKQPIKSSKKEGSADKE